MNQVAPAFSWHADTPEGDRHAFPYREDRGFPPPALCGLRWTVRYGQDGVRFCDACLGTLRRILSGAQDALTEAEFTNTTGDLDALARRDQLADGTGR